VHVVDGLAAVRPDVEDHPVAVLVDALFGGDLVRDGEDSCQERLVLQLADGLDGLDAERDRAARGLDSPAPDPILEVPIKPSRMIHFFDPSNEKMAAKLPDLAASSDILLGNLEDAVPVDRKEAARAGLIKVGREMELETYSEMHERPDKPMLDEPPPMPQSEEQAAREEAEALAEYLREDDFGPEGGGR